jgi:hypothetical protein
MIWMIYSMEYVSTEVESRFSVKGMTPKLSMSPRIPQI